MTINKKLVATSVLAIMMSLVLAPAVRANATEGNVSGSYKDNNEPVTGVVTEEETTTDSSPDFDNMTREELIEHTKKSLENDDNAKYTLIEGEDYIAIDLWFEGTGEFADMAMKDNTYVDSWDYIANTMNEVDAMFYNEYQKHNMSVYLYLVDDRDTDRVLTYCCDGEILYDRVHDGDADIKKIGRR